MQPGGGPSSSLPTTIPTQPQTAVPQLSGPLGNPVDSNHNSQQIMNSQKMNNSSGGAAFGGGPSQGQTIVMDIEGITDEKTIRA